VFIKINTPVFIIKKILQPPPHIYTTTPPHQAVLHADRKPNPIPTAEANLRTAITAAAAKSRFPRTPIPPIKATAESSPLAALALTLSAVAGPTDRPRSAGLLPPNRRAPPRARGTIFNGVGATSPPTVRIAAVEFPHPIVKWIALSLLRSECIRRRR
jgi:hypothetical protein